MKQILLSALMALAVLTACDDAKKQPTPAPANTKDSLQTVIDQKDTEINDMMGMLNDIDEGFRLINEAENNVKLMRNGEGSDRSSAIKENMQFIQRQLAQNRELANRLREQLRQSSVKGEELQRTIDNLLAQLDQKEEEINSLRQQLEQKDIHIAELDKTVNTLSNDVSNLKDESQQKSATISDQDRQLNTAWYVFGTKKELKEQRVLVDGKVLQQNFSKNYFTKIDIRTCKEIKLYSKSAKLLTTHPASAYSLTTDAKKQYVLRIIDPQLFWSTSKYLVIEVK